MTPAPLRTGRDTGPLRPPVRPTDENETAEQTDHGRGVHATWTYTLGSIVFIVLVLACVLVLMAVSEFNASPATAPSGAR